MSDDPRVKPLLAAAKRTLTDHSHDPHFADVEEQTLLGETVLFLARWDAMLKLANKRDGLYFVEPVDNTVRRTVPRQPEPIPMILFCPTCGVQHIDAPDLSVNWLNPPHCSHKCAYCQHVWRPADVPTVGVKDIHTVGQHDHAPVRGLIDKTARFRSQWRHLKRGSTYQEIGRGELQLSSERVLVEGDRFVAYKSEDNRLWFRYESEFDDGRFELIEPS